MATDVLYVAGGQQKYNMDGRYTTRDVFAFNLRLCVWSTVSIYGFVTTMFSNWSCSHVFNVT